MNKRLDKLKAFNKRKALLKSAQMVTKIINGRIKNSKVEPIKEDDPSIEKPIETEEIPTFENPVEEKFFNIISKDWDEEHKKKFIEEAKADEEFVSNMMKNYTGRNMLKCINTGRLLPKESFAVNVTLPMRGFRDAVSLNWETEKKKRF